MLGQTQGRPRRRPCVTPSYSKYDPKLLEEDQPEEPVRIVRTSGKEELVLLAVARCAATKLDAPESIDEDGLAQGVLHRVHELPRCEIEAIDRSRLCVVRDQECIAQRPEVRRSHSETPRLVQRRPVSETLHERAICLEDVDVTPCPSRSTGIRDIELSANVLYPKRREARWNRAIRKGLH